MKLFIIDGVFNDWTPGMVIIKAESLNQARDFFFERFVGLAWSDREAQTEFDEAIKNEDFMVLDLADGDEMPEGIVKVKFGGG